MNPDNAFGFAGAGVSGLDESGESKTQCTLGFAARKKIDGRFQEYWVTANHCAESAGSAGLRWRVRNFHLMMSGGPWLGSDSDGLRSRRHDAFAFRTRSVLGSNLIHVPTKDGSERLMRIVSVGKINGNGDRRGDRVCIVGAISGVRRCGALTNKVRSNQLVTRRLADIPGLKRGDSGGPVFRQLGKNRVELIGLFSGQQQAGDRMVYYHARDVLRKLG
jgi:hypothetical protein